MDTKDFFTRVFPQCDELVVSCLRGGIFWNRGSFTSIDAAAAAVAAWDAEPDTTVYYAVGAFAGHHIVTDDGRKKITRTRDKATRFKTLAFDLDIGPDKPYQTQREGNQQLQAAVRAIGLPPPMLVSSGNGIHAYWTLTESLDAGRWEKISIALRLALADNNLQIDTSKIHDPSMVLRPVGSSHKKQTPWKPVRCVYEAQDYNIMDIATALRPWFAAAAALPAPKQLAQGKKKSSIAAAVLQTNDVNVMHVATHCKQVRALIESGGETNAAGDTVEEPLWRASLGLAKYAVDPEEAVILLCGAHPDFDLDENMRKMDGWNGTGPTTCATFERLCPKGCAGCPSKGKITTPAVLNYAQAQTTVLPEITFAGKKTDFTPTVSTEIEGYFVDDSGVFVAEDTDDQGNVHWRLIYRYPIHISHIFHDKETHRVAYKMYVCQPFVGWEEEDHDVDVLSAAGKEFNTFLLNRKVFFRHQKDADLIRRYLMSYLDYVQQQSPLGTDFIAFGWQKDGSFLCGEALINSPTGSTSRRLKGASSRFADIIKPHGSRDKWVQAMQMLNNPGSDTIRSAILVAASGVLGPAAGNASMVMSIYSTETTTGKTLSLIGANSLIGSPRELFMNKNDTANALFKIRGVLNNLPCAIDELTAADDRDVVNLAYDLSQGREKLAMDRNREIREPVRWDGPTLITTNISLHQKFEVVQANNDPLKARTFEIHQHDRTFIQPDPKTGVSPGNLFFDLLAENNGWAMPELVKGVVDFGGPKQMWERGERAFMSKFGFVFEPQERFYRTAVIGGWVMGSLGKRLGLFPFDVNATTAYLLDTVKAMRTESAASRFDVFDIIGQYLQEHNDRLIEVSEVYGSGKEQVRLPAPERAVARVKIVHGPNSAVLPGSSLAINVLLFKDWLQRRGDSLDRITRELTKNGALIAKKERVTIFKGCLNRNPGQTHCVIVNLNHPRFVDSLTGTTARAQSPITLAVLNTAGTP